MNPPIRLWIIRVLLLLAVLLHVALILFGAQELFTRSHTDGARLNELHFSGDGKTVVGWILHKVKHDPATDFAAWDTTTGKRLWTKRVPEKGCLWTPGAAVREGKLAIVSGGVLSLTEIRTGKQIWQVKGFGLPGAGEIGWTFAGDALLVQTSGGWRRFSTTTGAFLNEIPLPAMLDHCNMALLGDDTMLVPRKSRAKNRVDLMVTDIKTGKVKKRFVAEVDVWSVSLDGTRLVTWDRTTLVIWDTKTGKALSDIKPPKHPVMEDNIYPQFVSNNSNNQIWWAGSVWKVGTKQIEPFEYEPWGRVVSADGQITLQYETRGAWRQHFPLGYLKETATGKCYAQLEGQTGW